MTLETTYCNGFFLNINDSHTDYSNNCYELTNIDINLDSKVLKLFEENIKAFPNFGGDIETLLFKCKITHSRRCVLKNMNTQRVLSYDDIKIGLSLLESQRGDDKDTIKQKQKLEERKERAEERAEARAEAKKEQKEEEKLEEEKERAKRQKRRENTINVYV